MNHSNMSRLLDLPDEILLMIFNQLNNMDVLYSMVDADNQRLDILAQTKMFTDTLNFILRTSNDSIVPLPIQIIDRFCQDILQRIDRNINYLIVDSLSMEHILHAASYPNLTKFKLFNFNGKIVPRYFTAQSSFGHIFQRQITDLTLVFENNFQEISVKHYSADVYEHIIRYMKNLQHLSIIGSRPCYYPPLTLRHFSITAFFSSTLLKLSIDVMSYEDCLALLDGRLTQLTTFIVKFDDMEPYSSNLYYMGHLPHLKYFSVKCYCLSNEYDSRILPLLHRMTNLEELTLHLTINDRTEFIDGNDIKNDILIYMPRLDRFQFSLSTKIRFNDLMNHLTKDIQGSFSSPIYKQTYCIINCGYSTGTCHVFSFPYMFDRLTDVGNTFPRIQFNYVRILTVHDCIPFESEFFLRLSWSFPLLKELCVINLRAQSSSSLSDQSNAHVYVKYLHLTLLSLLDVHMDYLEQFLDHTKTYLPCLTQLTIDYNRLTIVTENFTRDQTRINCVNVTKLNINETNVVDSKDFHLYFPLL